MAFWVVCMEFTDIQQRISRLLPGSWTSVGYLGEISMLMPALDLAQDLHHL